MVKPVTKSPAIAGRLTFASLVRMTASSLRTFVVVVLDGCFGRV